VSCSNAGAVSDCINKCASEKCDMMQTCFANCPSCLP
jgi:hypothetical protein